MDERKGLWQIMEGIFGKVFADRGYISKDLMQQLLNDWGIELVTGLKKNMHTQLPTKRDDMPFLRKPTNIEFIIDQLENISQLEHSRHRSVSNFMVNALWALIAHCHQPKKLSLPLDQTFRLVG